MSDPIARVHRGASKPSWVDRLILAIGIGLGAWVASRDLEEIESWLGFVPTIAGYEERENAYRARVAREHAGNEVPHVPDHLSYFALVCRCAIGLVFVSLAVGVTTLRQLREVARTGWATPGAIATVLACGGWSFFSLHEYAYRVWPTLQAGHVYSPLSFPIVDIGQAVAVWIIASWVILWLGGAWESSNDWRELWGRAVGFAWCAFWLLEWGTKRYFC